MSFYLVNFLKTSITPRAAVVGETGGFDGVEVGGDVGADYIRCP